MSRNTTKLNEQMEHLVEQLDKYAEFAVKHYEPGNLSDHVVYRAARQIERQERADLVYRVALKEKRERIEELEGELVLWKRHCREFTDTPPTAIGEQEEGNE